MTANAAIARHPNPTINRELAYAQIQHNDLCERIERLEARRQPVTESMRRERLALEAEIHALTEELEA